MKISYVDPHKFLGARSYQGDAGLDLHAASSPLIMGHRLRDNQWKHIDYIEYDTTIRIAPEDPAVTSLLFPRSSVSRHNLVLANSVGVIDNGYRDTIKVRFKYVPQPCDYIIFEKWLILEPDLDRIYKRGDRIAQLVFMKTVVPDFIKVDKLPTSARGERGFGSSGS